MRYSALGMYLDYFIIVRDIRWLRCVKQKYMRCCASIRDALARDGEILAIGMQKASIIVWIKNFLRLGTEGPTL